MALLDWLFPARAPIADAQIAALIDQRVERQLVAERRAMADWNEYYHTGPIANPNTGLLGPQDALSGTVPITYLFLTDFQLAQLYANSLARTICTEAPAWIAAAGHQIDVPESDDWLPDLDDRLGVSNAFGDAHGRANHLRGGGVLIDVEEDGEIDLSKPLDPRRVRRINRLIPLGGITLQVVQWQQDAEGDPDDDTPPIWRKFQGPAQPKMYRLLATMRQGGAPGLIHWTRILYFQGAPVPPDVDGLLSCPSTHYALSKLDLCWTSIRRFTTTAANAERIAGSHGAWWMTIKNKLALDSNAQQMGSGTGLGWVDRLLTYFNARKVFVGVEGDEIGNVGINLSGWSEIEQAAYIDASNSSRIPVPLLFTSLPKGFTSDADDWMPQWHGELRSQFRQWWAANLIRLYTLEYYRVYQRAPQWMTVSPGPWREPTDKERMAVRKEAAAEVVALKDAGIISAEEARTRYAPTFTIDFRVKEGVRAPAPVAGRAVGSPSESVQGPPAGARGPVGGTEAPQYGSVWTPVQDAADRVLVALEVDSDSIARLTMAVRRILPDLRPEDWPHVTLVYVGDGIPDRSLPVVQRAAMESGSWPSSVAGEYVGRLGDDAIVLFLGRRGLGEAQSRLLRSLAPQVRADQFPRFLPHVTIGHLGRELTEAEEAALGELSCTVRTPRIVVRVGGAEVAGRLSG